MIVNLFLLVTALLILIDSYSYPLTSIKYFNVHSTFILVLFTAFNILLALANKYPISTKLVDINKKVLFPILATLSILTVLADHFIHETFILNTIRIQPVNFAQLAALSGSIIYIYYAKRFANSFVKRALYFTGPILFILLVFLEVFVNPLFGLLVSEDNIFEYIQFVLFLATSFLALKIGRKLQSVKRKSYAILFYLLAASMFIISMEEISWTQRIIGLETPEEVRVMNLQDELTVHNLEFVQKHIHYLHILVGLYGAMGYMLVKNLRPKLFSKLSLFLPKPILFFYFFSTFMFSFTNKYMVFHYRMFTGEWIGFGGWQEVSELFLAFGFLMYAYQTHKKLTKPETAFKPSSVV